MDVQSLRYFMSVYQHLSFSKAARECFVTQPVISRKIAALEEEFQCVFFRRTRQGVLPTECGKQFLTYAEETLSHYEETLKSLSPKANTEETVLSIAAVTPAAAGFLPKTIAHFYSLYPGVQIALDRYTPGEMQDVLLGDAYDFYITVMPDLRDRDGFSVRKLLRDGINLLTTQEDAPTDNLQAATLLSTRTIFTVSKQDSPHFYSMILEQLDLLGVRHPVIREIRPLELLDYCVSANMGVAMSPAIHGGVNYGLNQYTFEDGPEIELGIAWRDHATPLMEAFLGTLRETLPT